MSSPIPGFGEARKAVLDIVGAEDPYSSARAFTEGSDDPSTLKIAEYALLIPVVKQGMHNYIELSDVSSSLECLEPVALQESVGTELGEQTVGVFEYHPHKTIINQFADRRSELVSYGHMIYTVEGTLRAASLFASSAMVGVALANGFAINREQPHLERPREQFVAAVKRSHQPAIARSVMHMLWNTAVNDEMYDYVEGLMMKSAKVNQDALVYDSSRDAAVLAKPLTRWLVSDDLGEIGNIPLEDARIGCPFSFEPELLKSFYEHVVDLMELKQCWPKVIADQEAVRHMEQLEASALKLPPFDT